MARKNWVSGLDISQRHFPAPVLAVLGPIFGLVYITILPLIGLVSFALLGLYRTREVLVNARRRRALRSSVLTR